MRVLILGGTGFIGPRVVRRLIAAGHKVADFHRGTSATDLPPEAQRLLGDRRALTEHIDQFRRFAPDVVVDMIAFTEADARSLIAMFRGMVARAVVISSGDVYRAYGVFTRLEQGPLEPVPITEDSPLRQVLFPYRASAQPGDPKYDYEKILVERLMLGDAELPTTVLRLPMVYGPGDGQHRLAPYLKRMLDGRPAILLDEGMARWRCLRGYVEDVAAAIALAVTNPVSAGRIYNVAEPIAYTEAQWVGRIASAFGWGGDIVAVPGGRVPVGYNTAQDLCLDTARIRAELGYREVMIPEEALRKAVEWQRDHMPQVAVDYAHEDRQLSESSG